MNQQQSPPRGTGPLVGRFDRDPGRWRPLFYVVEISVPVTAGGVGISSVQLHHQPYIMERLSGKIVGPTAVPSTSGLYQDGQWDFEFRDEQSNYQSGPMAFDLMNGGPTMGYSLALPFPIPFAGNKTLTFRVINRVARALVPSADYFTVQIITHGIADWGATQI